MEPKKDKGVAELLDRSIDEVRGSRAERSCELTAGLTGSTYCPALLAFDALRPPRRRSATYIVAIALHLLVLMTFAIHLHQQVRPPTASVAINAITLAAPAAPAMAVAEKTAPKPSPERNRQQRRLPRRVTQEPSLLLPIGAPPMPQATSALPSFLNAPAARVALAGPRGRPAASEQDRHPSSSQNASEAASPPSTPAPEGASSGAKATWEGEVLARLGQFRRYPAASRMRREEGVVYVRFRLDRTGHVLSSAIERASGFSLLDKEAQATVLRAQPLPSIPSNLPDVMELSLPIEFFIR